jgi:hypothetical protein
MNDIAKETFQRSLEIPSAWETHHREFGEMIAAVQEYYERDFQSLARLLRTAYHFDTSHEHTLHNPHILRYSTDLYHSKEVYNQLVSSSENPQGVALLINEIGILTIQVLLSILSSYHNLSDEQIYWFTRHIYFEGDGVKAPIPNLTEAGCAQLKHVLDTLGMCLNRYLTREFKETYGITFSDSATVPHMRFLGKYFLQSNSLITNITHPDEIQLEQQMKQNFDPLDGIDNGANSAPIIAPRSQSLTSFEEAKEYTNLSYVDISLYLNAIDRLKDFTDITIFRQTVQTHFPELHIAQLEDPIPSESYKNMILSLAKRHFIDHLLRVMRTTLERQLTSTKADRYEITPVFDYRFNGRDVIIYCSNPMKNKEVYVEFINWFKNKFYSRISTSNLNTQHVNLYESSPVALVFNYLKIDGTTEPFVRSPLPENIYQSLIDRERYYQEATLHSI